MGGSPVEGTRFLGRRYSGYGARMRTLWLLLLAAALAWGTWALLFQEDDSGEAIPSSVEDTQQPEGPPVNPTRAGPTTGTLAITVRTTNGHIPARAQAGFRHQGATRLKPLDELGRALFTDAPLGDLVAVATAPGYVESTQPRYLTSGIRTDVVLRLQTEADAAK